MKLIVLFITILSFQTAWTQETMEDFFTNKTQVVLLGLDFSQAKFIGKDGFKNPDGLKNHSIKGWNRFFASEPVKYSLQDAFGLKDKYYYNSINYFIKRNNEVVNTYRNITNEDHTITEEEIAANVATYTTFEKEGLAVSFVVESFNKLTNEAIIYVTFINLPENEIIHIERMVGKPGGGGQLNYWARAVYDIVNQIEKRADEFKKM
ncbi:MAG: hypothetical protein MK105_03110 [Crocinitomicaceae bacterium]|nr:hypothetical protein [Crocinitomicaceae bacterium]